MLHPSASDEARPLPAFNLGGRRVAVDVPHIAFVTVIAAWCAWYCSDAWRAAANIPKPDPGAASDRRRFAALLFRRE